MLFIDRWFFLDVAKAVFSDSYATISVDLSDPTRTGRDESASGVVCVAILLVS